MKQVNSGASRRLLSDIAIWLRRARHRISVTWQHRREQKVPARPAKLRGDRLIRWCTVLAVAAVAGVAAYISYWHAVEVVTRHGELAVRGHLYPVVIDGIIVAASMVVLDAARHAEAAPKLAWALLFSGIGVTLAANVAAGAAYGLAGAIWSAWPALAFVGCFELLMMLVRAAARRADADINVKTPGAPEPHPPTARGTGTTLPPPARTPQEPRRAARRAPGRAAASPVDETALLAELLASPGQLPSYRSWSYAKTGMYRSAPAKRAYDQAMSRMNGNGHETAGH